VSTAQVYKSQSRRPSGEIGFYPYDALLIGNESTDETAQVSPWTKIAAAKLAAEAEVSRITGLYTLVVRPSFM